MYSHLTCTQLPPIKKQACRYIFYILKSTNWHWGKQLSLYFKSISITISFSSWYTSIYKNWVTGFTVIVQAVSTHVLMSVSFNYTHFHFAAQVLVEWNRHMLTVPFLSMTGSSIYNSNWTWHCTLKALLNGETFEDEVCYKLKLHLRNSFSIVWTTIFIILIPY
jgi:hypothetical protein